MSKVSLAGNASGTGIFTIASPNSNTDRTLTLPDNTGTLLTQNSQPSFASTIGVGGATPAASGAGITFPATQSASSNANTLDDYEEGTWTPSFFGSSTAGTQAQISRTGSYIKIGRFIYLNITLASYTLTGATGNITLDGLPFSMDSIGGVSVYLEGIDPVYSGTPDNNITLGLRFLGGTQMAFGPTVSNGWDSYMTGSTTWTGGSGSTYGNISLWGIASA